MFVNVAPLAMLFTEKWLISKSLAPLKSDIGSMPGASGSSGSSGADGNGLLGISGGVRYSGEDDVEESESDIRSWVPLANGELTSVNIFCGYRLLSMSGRRGQTQPRA